MKKFIVSVLILGGIAGVIFIIGNNSSSSNTSSSSTVDSPISSSSQNGSQSNVTYKDGSYTGKVSNNAYGPVQVKAIVSGGKLSDIQLLQMPYDRAHSQQLSDYAGPILKSQAIKAQNAQVDGVSGATSTSDSFIKSLNDALSQGS